MADAEAVFTVYTIVGYTHFWLVCDKIEKCKCSVRDPFLTYDCCYSVMWSLENEVA